MAYDPCRRRHAAPPPATPRRGVAWRDGPRVRVEHAATPSPRPTRLPHRRRSRTPSATRRRAAVCGRRRRSTTRTTRASGTRPRSTTRPTRAPGHRKRGMEGSRGSLAPNREERKGTLENGRRSYACGRSVSTAKQSLANRSHSIQILGGPMGPHGRASVAAASFFRQSGM